MRLVLRCLAFTLLGFAPLTASAHSPSINANGVAWNNQTINWSTTKNASTVTYTVILTGQWIANPCSLVVTDSLTKVTYTSSIISISPYMASSPTSSMVASITLPSNVPLNVNLTLSQAGGNNGPSGQEFSPIVTKHPITGIVAQGEIYTTGSGTPDNSMQQISVNTSDWAASVIPPGWSDLQPDDSRCTNDSCGCNYPSVTTDFIETALTNIAAYNKAGNANVVGKLRIFPGLHSPQWAYTCSGSTTGVYVASGSNPVPNAYFPYWWTTNYRNAWKSMLTLLAAQYDRDPRIPEIAISSCSSASAEPYGYPNDINTTVMPYTGSMVNLHAAGFNDTDFGNCVQNAAADYSAWTNTAIDYTFNGLAVTDCWWESVSPCTGTEIKTTAPPTNDDRMLTIMYNFETDPTLTGRAVVANHGLNDPVNTTPGYVFFGDPDYPGFPNGGKYGLQAAPQPKEMQTTSPNPNTNFADGGWDDAFQYGICEMELNEFEMWAPTGFTWANGQKEYAKYSSLDLDHFSSYLANPHGSTYQPTCSGFIPTKQPPKP